jgi:putative membrane protein
MQIKFSNINGGKPRTGLSFPLKMLIMTLAIIIASYLIEGVRVDNVFVAIMAAIVISLLNNFIRPVLIVLTLPFTIFSMGLFLLVINALMILLASKIVPNFSVDGFGTALGFSVLITILNYLLELPSRMMNKKEYEQNNDFAKQYTQNKDDDFVEYEDVTDSEEENKGNKNDTNLLN